MDSHKSTSRYILTALAIILVITAFILIGLNALQLQNKLGSLPGLALVNQQTDQAYKDGYLAARTKYQALCPTAASEAFQLNGQVSANDGTQLQVNEQSLDTDPKVDGVSDTRTILVTTSTQIVEYIPKDAAQFTAEQQAFLANPTNQTPPSPNTIKSLALSDIKTGSQVTVASASDVRLAPTITATMIVLIPPPAPPTTPSP